MLKALENNEFSLPEREKIKMTKDLWNKAKEDKKQKEIES
jgi:hypothetical protein